jgi:hypothetical protein
MIPLISLGSAIEIGGFTTEGVTDEVPFDILARWFITLGSIVTFSSSGIGFLYVA